MIFIRSWVFRILGAILLSLLILWAACHIWLPGAIKNALEGYGNKVGYEIAYQDLTISPLRLRIELDGLHITDSRKVRLLELKKLVVMLKWSELILGEISFDEILVNRPSFLLSRNATKGTTGQWNWQEFIAAITSTLTPEKNKEVKKSLKISVDQLRVSEAALSIRDATTGLKEDFTSFSVELLKVANYDQAGEINGVRGEYGLNLGALQFTLPGINKQLAFKQVTITGALDNSGPEGLGAMINLDIDDGRIKTRWDIKNDKSIVGKVQLENLAIAPLIYLIPANQALQGRGGTLQAEVDIELRDSALSVIGNAHVLDLDIWEPGKQQGLMSWKSGDIERFSYLRSKNKGSSLLIDELMVSQPVVRFEIDQQGFSNFRRIFTNPSPTPEATVDQLSDSPLVVNRPSLPLFHLDMRSIRLRDGEVSYSDLAMRPNFHVDLRRLNASLKGVSNTPGQFASMEIDGLAARSGSVQAKGRLSFDDPRRNNDVTVAFKNLPLNALNPAAMNYAGYQITSGRLNLNLAYQTKDGNLLGSNQIVIKNVELGDEVPDFQGKRLPLGLAIALLEDSDDVIDVTINIAGNVDAPEFSATGLVWQAIANVLSNIATAPFRALGALLGMGGDGTIYAVVGEAVYLPPDQDRLEKFGDYLIKRPHASLELIGTYDVEQDKVPLARAIADTAILKAAGMSLLPNEPIPKLHFSDAKVQSALRAVYVQYLGRIKLGQRLLLLPDGPQRNAQLYEEIIASIPITDENLKTLANQRAKIAFDLMVKNTPDLVDRITVKEVKSVSAAKEGAPLELQARIK